MSKALNKVADVAKAVIKKHVDEIALLKTELKKANGEKIVSFKMPDTMEIKNFPEVQKVKIENHPAIQKVNVLNLKDLKVQPIIKFPDIQKVEITNRDKDGNVWIGELISHAVKGLLKGWIQRLDEGVKVRLADEERMMPLPVIMVDMKGRPINMQVPAPATFIPMMSGGGSAVKGTPIASIIGTGRKTSTTPATPVQLASSTRIQEVTITALSSNTNPIYIGDINVSAALGAERGTQLQPTGSVTLKITDLSKIYIDVITSTDGVTYTYLST